MIYAITTHSFLVTVELDANWQVQSYEVLNAGYHYGIAVIKDEKNRGPSNQKEGRQLIVYRGGKSVTEQDDPQLMVYRQRDGSFDLIGSLPFAGELGDVHQIAYANDGIYIANTGYNMLVFQSLESGKRHEYIFENTRYDKNHVNSVYPCGDQILVMLHNRSHKESEVVILRHDFSKGFALKQRLSLWHDCCHNVFLDDTYLLYGASRAKMLAIVDLMGERISSNLVFDKLAPNISPQAGHAKGLSVTKDYLVVGLSDHTARDKRSTSMGYLSVIDRHSLSILAVVDVNFSELPHPIGNINEIRCLTKGELAQSRSTLPRMDWSAMRLARNDPLTYYPRQIKRKLLMPARQAKRRIEKLPSSWLKQLLAQRIALEWRNGTLTRK